MYRANRRAESSPRDFSDVPGAQGDVSQLGAGVTITGSRRGGTGEEKILIAEKYEDALTVLHV